MNILKIKMKTKMKKIGFIFKNEFLKILFFKN